MKDNIIKEVVIIILGIILIITISYVSSWFTGINSGPTELPPEPPEINLEAMVPPSDKVLENLKRN